MYCGIGLDEQSWHKGGAPWKSLEWLSVWRDDCWFPSHICFNCCVKIGSKKIEQTSKQSISSSVTDEMLLGAATCLMLWPFPHFYCCATFVLWTIWEAIMDMVFYYRYHNIFFKTEGMHNVFVKIWYL